jgi:hypothetical protein
MLPVCPALQRAVTAVLPYVDKRLHMLPNGVQRRPSEAAPMGRGLRPTAAPRAPHPGGPSTHGAQPAAPSTHGARQN